MRNTPNYNLPQFDLTDTFSLEDYNLAFKNIDDALTAVQDTINSTESLVIAQEVIEARGGKGTLNEKLLSVEKTVQDSKSELNANIDLKINKTNIVNDLSTGGIDKVLSAEQGKALDTKVSTVQTNLTSEVVKNNNWKDTSFINIKYPPSPLIGAKGDGITDDTASIQAIINYSCSNGYKKIVVPNGTYKITSTLRTPQSFNQPIISGENPKTTIFNYSTIASGTPCIKFKGGSGQLANAYIENIQFIGNNASTGIEFADVCGMKALNCKFSANKIGLLLKNESANAFTEFVTGDNCDFHSECFVALEYRRELGNDSFHGSGLVNNCTINQSLTEVFNKIIIGTNCLPYNAPLDFTIWTHNSVPIIKNEGFSKAGFYGNIKVEPNAIVELCDSTKQSVHFIGGVLSNSQYMKLGKIVLCDRIQYNTDGSLNVRPKPYTSIKELTTGINDIVYLGDCETLLVDIRITAPNYEMNHTLIVFKGLGTSDGVANVISRNREFNNSGYGVPVFSVSDSRFKITCGGFPSSGVNAYISYTPIGNRVQHFIN